MAKLNQIIAVRTGIKSGAYSDIGELHKALQKPDLFTGFVRHYEPVNEEGEQLPPERKRVQFVAADMLRTIARLSTGLMDIIARTEWSNCQATADVKIGDAVILSKVPVTYLLFLEKQLTDLRTIVDGLPVLDEGESWTLDPNLGYYRSEVVKTHRNRKTQKAIVLYDATPEHPAQAQLISEDVLAGHWVQVKHSGGIGRTDKRRLAERVEALLIAVKEAREAANAIDEVPTPKVGDAIFAYLLEGGA